MQKCRIEFYLSFYVSHIKQREYIEELQKYTYIKYIHWKKLK